MWNNLTLQAKSKLMELGVKHGVTDLDSIRKLYNINADGGYLRWKEQMSRHKNLNIDQDKTYDYKGFFDSDPERAWNMLEKEPTTYFTDEFKTVGQEEVNNLFGKGGYKPSQGIRNRITKWEGSSMATNRPFDLEAAAFYSAIPASVRGKMSQDELDALYSYSYNVGAGNFKKRVIPSLVNLYNGRGSIEDVQNSMWASKDSKLRGLASRRAVERNLFARAYNNGDRSITADDIVDNMSNPIVQTTAPIITPDPVVNPIYNGVVAYTPVPLKYETAVNKDDTDNDFNLLNLVNEYAFTPKRLKTPEVILPDFSMDDFSI